MDDSNPPVITAQYNAPHSTSFILTQSIAFTSSPSSASSSSCSASTAHKAGFLSGLQKAVTTIQDQVNKELTSRMEEDKAREGAGRLEATKDIDEDEEEDNYGEEVQPED